MPIFNQTSDQNDPLRQELQIQTIIKRIIYLHEVISVQKAFDEEKLWKIAALKHTDLQNINTHPIKELPLLLSIITRADANHEAHLPLNSEDLIEPLMAFETNHGKYLDLVDLAITNPDSLQYRLPEFALFYFLFIRHISYDDETQKVDINLSKISIEIAEWSKWRQAKTDLNQACYQGHSGLIEKSQAQTLSPKEWLTDIDINRAFHLLNLDAFKPKICTFSSEDIINIGMAIHFHRIEHQHDSPKRRYAIPLILNNNKSLKTQGTHWTRALIIVTPKEGEQPSIQAFYTDSYGHLENKSMIESIINQALHYSSTETNQATGETVCFSAFPNATKQIIKAIGTGEQHDGYSCGYRALHGLIKDLNAHGFLPEANMSQIQSAYYNCSTSKEFRDFVYHLFGLHVPSQAPSLYSSSGTPNQTSKGQVNLQTTPNDFRTYAQRLIINLTTTHGTYLEDQFDLWRTRTNKARTTNIMNTLLYLRYKYWRSGESVLELKIKENIAEFIQKIESTEDTDLVIAIAAAHSNHFSKLTDHWTNHENKKGTYLSETIVEWNLFTKTNTNLAWKNDKYYTYWWNGKNIDDSDPMAVKNQVHDWLSNYKTQLWAYNSVNVVRKKQIDQLLEQINNPINQDDPLTILNILAWAKKDILRSDTFHDRSMASSLNDPLFQFLNALEMRIYVILPSTQMDQTLAHELEIIQAILSAFKLRGIALEELDTVLEQIDTKQTPDDPQTNSEKVKFQYIKDFFNTIISKYKPIDHNIQTLIEYCQEKNKQLNLYFQQCDNFYQIAFNEDTLIQKNAPFEAEKTSLFSNIYTFFDEKISAFADKLDDHFNGAYNETTFMASSKTPKPKTIVPVTIDSAVDTGDRIFSELSTETEDGFELQPLIHAIQNAEDEASIMTSPRFAETSF